MFVNLPLAELRDFQGHSYTIGTIGDGSVPSDRIPVWLAMECPRSKQQDHSAIRRWPTQHPLFISTLDEEHRSMMNDVVPFIALDQFKDVVFPARVKARQAIIRNTPHHPRS